MSLRQLWWPTSEAVVPAKFRAVMSRRMRTEMGRGLAGSFHALIKDRMQSEGNGEYLNILGNIRNRKFSH